MATEYLNYFKALSDETRLRLLHLLMYHELNVNEITAIFNMGQSRISRHLKILAGSGLISSRRDGLWAFYSSTKQGEASAFINSIRYLFEGETVFAGDLVEAERVIRERAREIKDFFNVIAGSWDIAKKDILGSFDLGGEIASRAPHCNVAVDLGCGTGDLLVRLKEKAHRIIGVDSSPVMLDLARRRFLNDGYNIELRLGELEHLPLVDGEANFAAMTMALHHLASPAIGIREAFRILNRGDGFYIADFDRHGIESLRTKYGDRWLGFDPSDVEQWLMRSGFSLARVDRFVLRGGLTICLYQSIKE